MLPNNTFLYVIFVLKFYSYQTSRLTVPGASCAMANTDSITTNNFNIWNYDQVA